MPADGGHRSTDAAADDDAGTPSGSGNQADAAIIGDGGADACGASPCGTGTQASSIDELITRCPSAATLAKIDADLDIRFEHGPLPVGDEVVCTAAQSGRPLTHLQERVYQALIAMRALHFDRKLAWTDLGLYDWLVQQVRGIRLRDDTGFNHCCDAPPGKTGPYISILVSGPLGVLATDLWASPEGGLYGLVRLLTHEARHVVKAHSCGALDTTIDELGAWGVEYELLTQLAYHSDPCFLRPTLPASSKYPQPLTGDASYLTLMRDEARRVQTLDFCREPSRPLANPSSPRACKMACASTAERCNLVDDDCDGKIDEDTQGSACGANVGVCTTGKVTSCDQGLEICDGRPPSQEICGDRLDNDCDGTVDGPACGACAGTTGQIFNGTIMVNSSADLAAIAGVGCITGDLHISTNFTDLSSFSSLQVVAGDLWINGNSQLQHPIGISSLRHVGRLFVENNLELQNLQGLESLASIDTFHLMITGNAKLESLDGLSGLTSIADQLDVEQNAVLKSIDGLGALRHVGGGVFVRNNPMLPACDVQKVLQADTISCTDCSGNDAAASCL